MAALVDELLYYALRVVLVSGFEMKRLSVYSVQGLYEHCLTYLNSQELDLYCLSLGMSWPPLEASSGGLSAVLKVGSRSKRLL
jgi:hypothetical protein